MILQNKRIFIVEDNVQNRMVFRLTLMKHGAMVDFESSGRETRDYLMRTRHLDVIILDLMLPGFTSGFEVYSTIRQFAKFAKVPVIAVSAMDPAVAIPKTRAAGFAGFIMKPIDVTVFPDQIARVAAGEQIWYAGERGLP